MAVSVDWKVKLSHYIKVSSSMTPAVILFPLCGQTFLTEPVPSHWLVEIHVWRGLCLWKIRETWNLINVHCCWVTVIKLRGLHAHWQNSNNNSHHCKQMFGSQNALKNRISNHPLSLPCVQEERRMYGQTCNPLLSSGFIATMDNSLLCLLLKHLLRLSIVSKISKMHESRWDVLNFLCRTLLSSTTVTFLHCCASNAVSWEPPSSAAVLMVTEQFLRCCREFSALLRGTSAVVFKDGDSINHFLSPWWRSANSAASQSLAGFSST